MSATIKDVATAAGVSVATVSRVLNGSERVRDQTRQRVLDAARDLDYVPNETARSLIRKQTQMIGVLLPDVHGEFFAQVIQGLDAEARVRGYHLLVSSSHSDEAEAQAIIRALRSRVDGFAIMWPRPDTQFLDALLPPDTPAMLLNADPDASTFPALAVDNRGGAYAAVRHLVEHGHERIAFLSGEPNNRDARERRTGYRLATRDLDVDTDPELVLDGDFMQEAGHAATDSLLHLDPRPTALFAANDAMAMGALRGLDKAGLRVPDDLALVGFDDIPTAQYVAPPLTTVRVPARKLGHRAMQCLLARIDGNPINDAPNTLDTTLVIRRSCGCAGV